MCVQIIKRMNIDIDDILAELDRDTTAVDQSIPTFPSDGNTTRMDFSMSMMNSEALDLGKLDHSDVITPSRDYSELIVAWKNERCSPELLPYPKYLMSRLLHRVQKQMEHIENISMGFLEESININNGSGNSMSILNANNDDDDDIYTHGNNPINNNNKLHLLCMEAELERVKFVIRSFIRCRLNKIDKYSLYLRQLEDDETDIIPLNELLSDEELVYHEKHFSILLKLLNNSILKHMPTELQAIDDTEATVNMVDEPDWKKFVFIYVKEVDDDSELDRAEHNNKPCYKVTIKELEEDVELTIGGIYVMRYEVVRQLLMDKKIELV